MTRWKNELTTCPDCGVTVFCCGGLYDAHYRSVSLTRRELCPSSHMPVIGETRPLLPIDHTAEAWEAHVRAGGD